MANTIVQDKAQRLASDPTRWTAARRKADGREFWIVVGATGTYYTDRSGRACTCPGWNRTKYCYHTSAAVIRERRDNQVRVVSEAAPSLEEARDELRAALARTTDPAVRHKILDSLEPIERQMREARKARLRRELGMSDD